MATLTCGTACLGFCLSLLISYKLCWKMLLAHSCPTLCDPMDCSLPGSCLSMGFSGVACHFLLQVIFPTQRSNLGLLHCRQIRHYLSHQGKWFSLPSCIPKSEWNSEQVTPRCSSLTSSCYCLSSKKVAQRRPASIKKLLLQTDRASQEPMNWFEVLLSLGLQKS